MDRDIPLRDVMVQEVVTGNRDLTVLEAAKLMRKHRVDSIIVVDQGVPVGIITEGDIISKVVSKDTKPSTVELKEIMTTQLVTASPNDSVSEIARKMSRGRIRKIPVVDEGMLIGVVADVDILSVSAEMNSLLAELLEIKVDRGTFSVEGESESSGQGICEKCGDFSHYLSMNDGLMVCESCKEELETMIVE